ncbi:MAG TPA: acyltransferase family protein [Parvibaculum sp.]
MAAAKQRVNWIDAVKGLTITLVVMKHTTYGDAVALHSTPYLFNLLCEFTIPFRMPLFFLVAGLFADKALRGDSRDFIDKKILHFAYFYLLWSVIQVGIKVLLPHEGAWAVSWKDLALIPLEPFGLLWFIYALAVFFVLMRMARDLPKSVMLGVALALYFTRLDTGWTMPDEFAHRFVFFVSGVYAAPYVFRLASWAIADARRGIAAGIGLLAGVGVAVFTGLADLRAVELAIGFMGAAGTIMIVAVLASRGWAKPLAYIGSRSLYVFLAFFLPMAATRIALIRLGLENGDLVTLIALAMAVGMPLLAFRLTEGTPLAFLFTRPQAFRLKPRQRPATAPLAA